MILPFSFAGVGDVAPYSFLRRFMYGRLRGVEHIFDENSVACRRVVDQYVRHSSHELAVLDDRGARHECGQVGTTHFYNFLTVSTLFVKKKLLYCSI